PSHLNLFPYTTLFRSLTHRVGRVTGDSLPVRHIAANDRTRFNNRARAHVHAFQNRSIVADPDIVIDHNGLGLDSLTLTAISGWRSEEHTSELQSRENL